MEGPSDPHQKARQLMQMASTLEGLSRGQLAGLTERLRKNKGRLSLEDELKIRSFVRSEQDEVQRLITSVLTTSAQFSQQKPVLSESSDQLSIADFQKPSLPPKKSLGMTIMDDDLLPLPETASTVQKSPPRMPQQASSPKPEEPVPLGDLPGPIQENFKLMIDTDPQKFVDTYLAPAFSGKFDQLKFIAKGGMGMIVRGRQVGLNRNIAIKLNTQMTDPALVQSFMNEGRHAAQLGFDPNVVAVIETNKVRLPMNKLQVLVPYHVLEFVEGAKDGTFLMRAMEKAGKPFPEEAALLLTKQYAKGLNAAHKKDVVHRDVKPDNVLIPPDEQGLVSDWIADADEKSLIKGLQDVTGLKVADFGLAGVRSRQIKSMNTTSQEHAKPVSEKHTLTGDNSIIGTLYYIPPEGYGDSQSAGMPWDVYSLGLVFYAFLTGHEDPLKHSKGIKRGKETTMSYAIKIGGDEKKTPAISEDDPHIKALIERDPRNKRIVKMLQKMTAFNPKERPTLEECLQWIDRELDKRSEKTLRVQEAEKEVQAASKGKRRAAGIGGVVAVGLLLALGGVQVKNKLGRDAERVAALEREEARVAAERAAARERDEARVARERLLSDGEALLAQKNYDAARAKFREAGDTARVEACDQRECKDRYGEGLIAYHRGDVPSATRLFGIVSTLHESGLTEAERQKFRSLLELLQTWPGRETSINQRALEIFDFESDQEYTTALGEIYREIQTHHSEDDFSILIRLWGHINQRARTLRTSDTESPEQVSERVRNDEEVIKFLQRRTLVKSSLFNLFESIRDTNPNDVRLLQEYYVYNVASVQAKIDVLLRNNSFEESNGWYVELFRCLDQLMTSADRFGIGFDPPEGGFAAFCSSTAATALTGAKTRMPPRNKASLAALLQAQFPSNALIASQVAENLER